MKVRDASAAVVYAAADRFVDAALRHDGSLFTAGVGIWTKANLDELHARFVAKPDESSDDFLSKFHRQLAGAPDATIQLAAEALYVHFLIAVMSGAAKRAVIEPVLGWMREPVKIPTDLDAALDHGLASPGTAFHTRRPYQLGLVIEFVREWKALPADRRDAALRDPWAFKDVLFAVPMPKGSYVQREALLHLVHPDTFESIVSRAYKEQIAAVFSEAAATDEPDIDRRLAAARAQLEAEYGRQIDWYEDELARKWLPIGGPRPDLPAEGSGPRAWIFQSSPDRYDLAGALTSTQDFTWLVNQYEREIHAEDQVFLWETGPQAGILASGRIVSEPMIIDENPTEGPFYRAIDKFSGPRLRVRVAVERVLRPRLTRQQITADVALVSLPNLRLANATNFKLTPDQTASLDELVRKAEAEPWAAPGLTVEDFEVLAAHQTSQPWDELSDEVRTAYGRLRDKLDLYAARLADGLGTNVRLKPFVSHPNPSGRNPLYQWCCVYPESVANKSYGFQLALIVKPGYIEYGFCLGSATGGTSNEAKLAEFQRQLASTRERLLLLRTDPAVVRSVEDARSAGLGLRSRWLRAPDDPGIDTFDEWAAHASSSDGGGASFSGFASRDDVGARGPGFLAWLAGQLGRVAPLMERLYAPAAGAAVPPVPSADTRPLAQLAQELSLEASYLEDVDWLLRDRKQLVFYGPPGTGKTYVAEAFAEWFAGSRDRVETIQFHPSYAYEDFVEGIRPKLDATELRYALVPGVLRRFATRAEQDSRPHVLIIDEINRANLARVFGELLYLLEYRDRTVRLPYSQEQFGLPGNVYVIGTMNTADRSIALVDFALRRRFHFIEFPAAPEILRRWLVKNRPTMVEVADLLAKVNAMVGSPDFAIGFSYFMRQDLDERLLSRIWERSIQPALAEYFFSEAGAGDRFSLARVRAALKSVSPDEADDSPSDAMPTVSTPEG
jgi:MoxR-like ATPase